MGLLRSHKTDPISDRAQALNAEIAALEQQIRELDAQLTSNRKAVEAQPDPAEAAPSPPGGDVAPVFEAVSHRRVQASEDPPATSTGHFNELGVRKYDLAGAWNRLRRHLQGPPASNPRLINYLAAGSIQGLRPLRYEKRVARNRVVALALLLLFVLWGLITVLRR